MALSGQTIGFVGCGNMGGAVLKGILNNTFPHEENTSPNGPRFIACTKSEASANRLKESIPEHQSRIQFLFDENLKTMQQSDVIILGFKPYMAEGILTTPGVREALHGKLVISMLAGVTPATLSEYVQNQAPDDGARPLIVRAIPNMAAAFSQSITVIESANTPLPTPMADALEWIFKQVGQIKYIPSSLFDAGTLLVGASIATLTLPIEGLLDGFVAEGFKRAETLEVITQAVRGLAACLESGTHPAVLRESITSPRGSTIQSLMTLEKAAVRAAFAESVGSGTKLLKKKI